MGERVVMAMSGGVDSSVAAALLVEQGVDVVGVTLHLWDASGEQQVGRCCAPEDREDARLTCDYLGIPHYTLDEREAFRAEVIEPFLDSYRAGETPLPCANCNRTVKLVQLASLAKRFGASRVGTGHYVRSEAGRLKKGVDTSKDQSYFLFGVPGEVLQQMVFPLGDMTKDEVREHGRRLGVPNADKPDSQELCFVPDGDVRGFVQRERGPSRAGNIVDTQGRVLAAHEGIERFTVGQRRGLGLGGGAPKFVLKIIQDDVVVGNEAELAKTSLVAKGAHWLASVDDSFRAAVRIRHRHPPADARIERLAEGRFRATFDEPQRAVTPGQAAVVYLDDEVLGGGFIEASA